MFSDERLLSGYAFFLHTHAGKPFRKLKILYQFFYVNGEHVKRFPNSSVFVEIYGKLLKALDFSSYIRMYKKRITENQP
jgi:hypothetical protein